MRDISTRPGTPRRRPECSGNIDCMKMSPALPLPGTSAPASAPLRESR